MNKCYHRNTIVPYLSTTKAVTHYLITHLNKNIMTFTAQDFTLQEIDSKSFKLKLNADLVQKGVPSEFGIEADMPYVIYSDGTKCKGMGVSHSSVKEWGANLLSVNYKDFRPDTIQFNDGSKINLPGIFTQPR